MKKLLIIVLGLSFLIQGFVMAKEIDRGIINNDNTSEEDLVTLTIHKYISIVSIDNETIKWNKPKQGTNSQIVQMSPGIHTFTVNYNTGTVYTIHPVTVIGQFVKGQSYIMRGSIDVTNVVVNILNIDDNSDVTLNIDKLRGNTKDVLSSYINYVLNPTMDESNKIVKLSNQELTLIYKPDMIFEKVDNITGKKITGRRGFITDFSMTTGTTYLLETDITKMSREDFLNNSNYSENAQTILTPTSCDAKTVTYTFVKPESLKGKVITLNIEVLQ